MFEFLLPIFVGILIGLELQVLITKYNKGAPVQPIMALINIAERFDKKTQTPKKGQPPKLPKTEQVMPDMENDCGPVIKKGQDIHIHLHKE